MAAVIVFVVCPRGASANELEPENGLHVSVGEMRVDGEVSAADCSYTTFALSGDLAWGDRQRWSYAITGPLAARIQSNCAERELVVRTGAPMLVIGRHLRVADEQALRLGAGVSLAPIGWLGVVGAPEWVGDRHTRDAPASLSGFQQHWGWPRYSVATLAALGAYRRGGVMGWKTGVDAATDVTIDDGGLSVAWRLAGAAGYAGERVHASLRASMCLGVAGRLGDTYVDNRDAAVLAIEPSLSVRATRTLRVRAAALLSAGPGKEHAWATTVGIELAR